MALSNHDRVGKALDLLSTGLKPFVERELPQRLGPMWETRVNVLVEGKRKANWADPQVLLAVMASMFGVYHGPDGLRRIATRVARTTAAFASLSEAMRKRDRASAIAYGSSSAAGSGTRTSVQTARAIHP